jgi:hypothetical protein
LASAAIALKINFERLSVGPPPTKLLRYLRRNVMTLNLSTSGVLESLCTQCWQPNFLLITDQEKRENTTLSTLDILHSLSFHLGLKN